MKKTVVGIGFVLLAAYLLFRDMLELPDLGMSLWSLLLVAGFTIGALQNLLHRQYLSAYVCGIISFIILENHFDWLDVSTGTIILAAVLAGIGLNMIFKPRRIYRIFGKTERTIERGFVDSETVNTVFENATRYINDDNFTNLSGDVVFSGASIYFNNAIILGDVATYSGDTVFSIVTLYVPRNWNIEFTGDRVFSKVQILPSGVPTDKTLRITGDAVFSQLSIVYI